MNLQFYLEKLSESEKFKEFMKENPKAYFCSGFFAIDKQEKGDKIHLDYFVPESKKMFSFQLENEVEMVPVEQMPEKELEKIPDSLDFDFKEIENLIEERMEKEKIKNKVQKILLSLQKGEGKLFLLGTVFISGLGMIKIRIDLEEKKILDFEKKSFFDMMKIVKKKDSDGVQ